MLWQPFKAMRLIIALLILFVFITDLNAADVKDRTPIHAQASVEMVFSENVKAYQRILFKINFPNRSESKELVIPVGFKVSQTLEYMYVVKYGKVCLSEKAIWSINEYDTNLDEGRYWTILLNGNFLNVNSETVLNEGDSLELSYHRPE